MQDPTTMQIHRAMRGLVASFGKDEVSAQLIADRRGGDAQKGTLSKKKSAQLEWDIIDVMALEDAAGRYPVTAILAARLVEEQQAKTIDMMRAAAECAKEAGEANAALLQAIASGKADDMAQAAVEWREAADAFQRALPAFNIARPGDAA